MMNKGRKKWKISMRQMHRFPHPLRWPFPPETVSLYFARYLSVFPTRLDSQTGSLAIRALETIAPPELRSCSPLKYS